MSTPSLLNIPYVIKAGTLYSQIPETGAGDFTVTRATSPTANRSTRINANGFIELVNDNVPRLDYPLGGAVNGCPALLVEPSAQNLALQSADFNTTWLAQNSATVNTNTAISPDGTQNADTINLAAVADSRISQTITVANSTTYTISCFYKNIALTAGQTFNMRFNNFASAPNDFIARATIDLASGTASYFIGGTLGTGYSGTATGRIENYGNGWYRVSLTFTVGTAGGNAGGFQPAQVSPATARSFYAFGAQLETGSIATSYIPTTTQAITRGAEVITRTSASALIGQTEGTLYAEFFVDFNNRDADIFSVDGGSTSDGFFMSIRNSSVVQLIVRTASANALIFQRLGAYPTGVNKLAVAYKNGDFAICLNGTTVQTNTSSITMPSVSINRTSLGRNSLYTLNQQLRIRAVALYPNRLLNSELATLTT